MGTSSNSPIEEDHVCVENSQLIRNIERVDFVFLKILQVIHLPALAVFHHEDSVRRKLPVDLWNFQPLDILEMCANLKA